MDGPLVEYSGPKLALFKYAQMARLVIHSGLFVALFLPWGSDWISRSAGSFSGPRCSCWSSLSPLVAATHARYRH